MKIMKNSSIKATTWMGKYKDVKGNWKKVYFDVGSEDFDEVEELFEESISEPYTTMRLLGRAPSESLLKRDGFSKIELCMADIDRNLEELGSVSKLGNKSTKYKV